MFQVKIEKNVYVNVVTSASLMSGCKLYLSNPWYDALDGVVRNLKWTNLPSMSTYPLANSYLGTTNQLLKSSSTDAAADFGPQNAVDGSFASGWKGDFVSGAAGGTMKKRHWIEIQLVNEMMTVGVKVTAMLATKATDIFEVF